MIKEDINEILRLIHLSGTKHIFKSLSLKSPELYRRIVEYNKGRQIAFMEMVYQYFHQLDGRPPCLTCHKPVKRFYGFARGYGMYCSRKCVASDELTKKRRLHTIREKYGVDQLVDLREERKQ